MAREILGLWLAPVAALTLAGCGAGSPASALAQPPPLETKDARCSIQRNWDKPLVVEWPSADRLELEARAKSGLVVVHYSGCTMRMLPGCRVDGRYVFTPTTPKSDTIAIRNADELYAAMPVGAAAFEGKLEKYGQLNVSMTMVGRLATTEPEVGRGQLSGSCRDATHVIAGITVGAFEFFAGAGASVGAGVDAVLAKAGTQSSAQRETFTRDGSPAACGSASATASAPPPSCGAVLRVEVVPINSSAKWRPVAAKPVAASGPDSPPSKAASREPDAPCPAGSRREGDRCVSRFAEGENCSFVGDCSAACEAGTSAACLTLGKLHESGKGGTRDLPRAAEAYRLGCDQGNLDSCVGLATAYYFGDGVLADIPRAVSLFESGCKKKHPESCYQLGVLYIDRRDKIKPDVNKGISHWASACDHGHQFACRRLSALYGETRSAIADPRKAKHYLERACKLGDTYACRDSNKR